MWVRQHCWSEARGERLLRGRGRGREGLLLKGGQTRAQLTGIYLLYSSVYIILANPLPSFVVFSQSTKYVTTAHAYSRLFVSANQRRRRRPASPRLSLSLSFFIVSDEAGERERDSIGVRVIISINQSLLLLLCAFYRFGRDWREPSRAVW